MKTTNSEIQFQHVLYCFQNITIQENSPGKDGAEYILNCYVKCNSIPKNVNIPPLTIPFLFYNGELIFLIVCRIVRKPDFCLCENKGADQLRISFAVTAKLISAFVFATRIVQFLFFLNPKFQAASPCL